MSTSRTFANPRRSMTSALCVALSLVAAMSVSGCYTRLTTPKEAVDYRAMFPEIEEGMAVSLGNAHENMGNTFVMTADVYLTAYRKYLESSGQFSASAARPAYRFKPFDTIDIRLPFHENDPINKIYTVRPEGTIDIGFISGFVAAGKTSDQIRDELSSRLSRWYRAYPYDDERGPVVEVNLPVFKERIAGDLVDARGTAYILNLSTDTNTSSSGAGGRVVLQGTSHDRLSRVLARAGGVGKSNDWNDIAIYREVKTTRVVDGVVQPFEFTLIIVGDFQKILFQNPNLDPVILDNDMVIIHPEKNPLIIEIVETAATITSVWGAFTGAEGVLEDIFKRDF